MSSVLIRPEEEADRSAVRAVLLAAFETSLEADIVDALGREVAPVVSLVAEEGGVVLGHIMFSPVTLEPPSDTQWMSLGPMAVLPARQRSGIGTRLVRAGMERCRGLAVGGVVVVGHPTYYPRFGFVPAADFGMRCEFDVPSEAFMVRELGRGSLTGRPALVRYAPAFASD